MSGNKLDTKPIDLTLTLAPYKTGWVAVDKKNNVIAHAKSFDVICKKVKDTQNLTLIPASDTYFGFITAICD